MALASAKNRLELKDAKDVQNVRKEDVTLQSVIAELLIENRRCLRSSTVSRVGLAGRMTLSPIRIWNLRGSFKAAMVDH